MAEAGACPHFLGALAPLPALGQNPRNPTSLHPSASFACLCAAKTAVGWNEADPLLPSAGSASLPYLIQGD